MRTLQDGDDGADVMELQSRLASAGFPPGAIDGSFGPGTHAAVVTFQQSNGLLRGDGAKIGEVFHMSVPRWDLFVAKQNDERRTENGE